MYLAIAVIVLLAIFLWLAGLSVNSGRKVGKVDYRFDYSHYNGGLMMSLLIAAIIIWLVGVIEDEQVSYVILMLVPLQMFLYNPVYLGVKGIKVGSAFIARDLLQDYKRTAGSKRIAVDLIVEGREKPIKLGIYRPNQEETMMQALAQYFNKQ